jgi:radical SAM superfamily enzyme YgiQ (UPF0313 family)
MLDKGPLPYAELLAIIREEQCAVVGFFCDHDNREAVCAVSRRLRADNPTLVMVAGGPEATCAPHEVMTRSSIDVVVRGEGEITFCEILHHFVRGAGELPSVLGITYRAGDQVVQTPDRPPIANLDLLPIPDRNLVQGRPRGKMASICTGRGCPHRCAFCAATVLTSKYRYRSVESVLREVDHLLEDEKTSYISIVDDTFTADPERAVAISHGLQRRRESGRDFVWFCEARADILARHPHLLPTMREAGLVRIQIGIESGNQHVLDAYRKGITLEQIRRAIAAVVEADVPSAFGNFIIGGAHETHETVNTSIAFAQELMELAPGRLDLSTSLLAPYPGTEVSRSPHEFGLRILDPDCATGPTEQYCFVETEELTKWEILDARVRFEQTCAQTMRQLLKDRRVPESLMTQHVRLRERYGITTLWLTLCYEQTRMRAFFNLLLQDDYAHSSDIDDCDLDECHPLRTCLIGSSRNGSIILEFPDDVLEMDALGTAITELCAGKLRFTEIVDEIARRFFPEVPKAAVRALVLDFLQDLERKYLLVWCKL